jgi:dihydroxyacid dehydratase/phosphogluconate dehydratase
MTLHRITATDHGHQVVAPRTLADLKALHNALAVDVATGGDTSPGIDAEALLDKVERLINLSLPPQA